MEIQDIQKEDNKEEITTIRLTKKQKDFVEEKGIVLGILVRKQLNKLIKREDKKCITTDVFNA